MIKPKIMENMTNKQIHFLNNSIDLPVFKKRWKLALMDMGPQIIKANTKSEMSADAAIMSTCYCS